MNQANARPALMQYLDECSPERVQELARRELKPLLDALSFDPAWRERFVIRRVREGVLSAQDWGIFITSVDEELKEELLNVLETEDLTRARVPGVQGLLRLTPTPLMVRRIFRRIVALREEIHAANSVRSLENLALVHNWHPWSANFSIPRFITAAGDSRRCTLWPVFGIQLERACDGDQSLARRTGWRIGA